MQNRAFISLVLIIGLTATAGAQVGLNGIQAGVGTMTLGPVNTNALTGGNGELGIQYYPGDGKFYVSRRGTGAGTVAPHNLVAITQAGAVTGVTVQGPGAGGGVWGHRDGATDAYAGGTKLFWGDDFGIHCYEMSSGSPVYLTGVQTVMATNGPQSCTFPLAVQTFTGGITRALEYNPNGNGGNGSFWACNFNSALVETTLAGSILVSFPVTTNPAPQWSAYGLAMDLQSGMLWVNSSPAGSVTVIGDIAELNPATGLFTGRRFKPAGTITTGPWIYAAQGGLSYVQGRTGPTFGPGTSPPYGELVALTQGTPDNYAVYRLDHENGFPSGLETKLEASLNGGVFSTAAASFTPGTTLSLQYNTPAANPGSAAVLIANFGAPPIPSGNTFGVIEFVALNNISIPTASASGIGAFTLGDGFALGGLLAPDLLVMSPVTQPAAPFAPVPMPSLGGPGTRLTLQAVYVTTSFTPIATNIVTLTEL